MVLYELCNQFTEIALWTEPDMHDIRQNTTYGIAVVARVLSPDAFKSLVPNCMQAIELVLSHPEAESEEVLAAVENAMIALGTLALLHTKVEAHVNKFL